MADWKELAKASGINERTMQKLAGGHQPLTDKNLTAMRMAVELRKLTGQTSILESSADQSLSIELHLLDDEHIHRLQDFLTKQSRRDDIDNDAKSGIFQALDAIVREQRRRIGSSASASGGSKGVQSAPLDPGQERERKIRMLGKVGSAAASQALERERRAAKSETSQTAASSSESSGEPADHTRPRSKAQRTPPGQVPK